MPVIDKVAADYQDRIRFIAVAGRSNYERTAERAPQWFGLLEWGYDDSIWGLYNIPGQPSSVLITGNDVVVDHWFGVKAEDDLRSALDTLLAYG